MMFCIASTTNKMPKQCALLCTTSSRVTLLMKTTTIKPWQCCVGRLFNVWSPLQLWRLPIDFAPFASVVALRRHLQWEVPSSKVLLICTYWMMFGCPKLWALMHAMRHWAWLFRVTSSLVPSLNVQKMRINSRGYSSILISGTGNTTLRVDD